MAALPKKKTSKARKGTRNSQLHMRAPKLSRCPHCHSARLPHHVCPSCGYYKGREAVAIGEPELPSAE